MKNLKGVVVAIGVALGLALSAGQAQAAVCVNVPYVGSQCANISKSVSFEVMSIFGYDAAKTGARLLAGAAISAIDAALKSTPLRATYLGSETSWSRKPHWYSVRKYYWKYTLTITLHNR